MATGYTVTGRGDLDAIFKARVSAAGGAVGYLSNGGVDLSQRFEPRGSATPVANTGFKAGGNDLAVIFQDISAVANTITIADMRVEHVVPSGSAIAQYALTNAGDITNKVGTPAAFDVGDWLTPKSNFGNYSARATLQDGPLPTGTFGSWLTLDTTRTWGLSSATLADSTFLLEIRSDADGIVRDTALINLYCERTT